MKTRTKLTLIDIHKLIELCLGTCYFLYDHRIRVIKNAEPIGPSLMVIIAEAYLQHIETRAIAEALSLSIVPITYKRYVDDTHARFKNNNEADEFLKLLNKQDQNIQFTIEYESNKKSLSFLDTEIINTQQGHFEFKIYRKDAITNIQIKPTSAINPNIINSIFKGFLNRAKNICSDKYYEEEIEFLTDMFVENGFKREKLTTIIASFNAPKQQKQPDVEQSKIVKLPWIPTLGPKLRNQFKLAGYKTIFTSPTNLKQILCRNKCPLLPNSYPGVYQLNCSCGSLYIGETKKKILTRSIEHQTDSIKGKWESSGATEHTKTCHGQFN